MTLNGHSCNVMLRDFKMKVFKLKKNTLNIQKCLLPDCKFLNENYARYCSVRTGNCEFIVKIGLCEIKSVENAVFLDDSVLVFSSFDKINRIDNLSAITFDNIVILDKPLISDVVKITIVFDSIFEVKKFKGKKQCLERGIRDVLKLYVITSKCAVFFDSFSKLSCFNIHCLILSTEKSGKVFRISSNTEVIIEKCISKLQFDQLQIHKDELHLGGCNRVYEILKETVEFSKSFDNHKLKLVKKLLLVGPSGCGKTTLVHKIAKDCKIILLEVTASQINSLTSDGAEKKLKDIFIEAKIYSENQDCCIILFEDVDLMCIGKSSHSKQFVRQLIGLLKDIESIPRIVVIATTNSPDEVDVQLRMPKRLEDELEISIPTLEDRQDIIKKILQHCNVIHDNNMIHQLALWTPGFVGADLKLAVLETLMLFIKTKDQNHISDASNLNIMLQCFKEALTKVIPSALRGTVELCTANIMTFSQIGGLDKIKQILDLSVKQQLEKPEKFSKLGIPLTKGILLYGPPGCAKTTLVKALAKECNATFLATSAAEMYSPFVGDSEKKLVQLFTQARIGSPSILFIDEIDAVVGSKSGTREKGVQERILSTLLIEMDGVGLKVNTQRENSLQLLGEGDCKENITKQINNEVIVIGATNRPQLLDDALKRPGRFDRLLYIPPPEELERLKILQKLTEKMPLHESVNLEYIAKVTNYFSGADLKSLCQESGLFALKSSNMSADCINQSHFEHILKEFQPSLNQNVINFYESFQKYNT